jgi:S-methylmethionine-dependent homocysteine/selenocysteine methylase
VLGDDGRLLSGETLAEAVAVLAPLPISAILINCSPRAVTTRALRELRGLTELPIGGYANLGIVDETVGWSPDHTVDGPDYGLTVREWLAIGAALVGGCCGTQPKHIAPLRPILDLHRRTGRFA